LAAVLATGTNFLSLPAYLGWKIETLSCQETLAERGLNRMAESALAKFVLDLNAEKQLSEVWDASVRAEGRVKAPILDRGAFQEWLGRRQRDAHEGHCSENGWFLRSMKATETHTYLSSEGRWLASFSIGSVDCPQW
jgi:hypothetical protein